MQMTTLDDLFTHELGDVLYAERLLEKALPKMAQEATDEELREAFTKHHDETKSHIRNIEQVFDIMGKPASAERCPGMEGIKKEHDEFMQEPPPAALCDVFLTGSAARAEHYEIAAYSSLIDTAKALGEDECARLLEENLSHEQHALTKLQAAGKRLAKRQAEAAA